MFCYGEAFRQAALTKCSFSYLFCLSKGRLGVAYMFRLWCLHPNETQISDSPVTEALKNFLLGDKKLWPISKVRVSIIYKLRYLPHEKHMDSQTFCVAERQQFNKMHYFFVSKQ